MHIDRQVKNLITLWVKIGAVLSLKWFTELVTHSPLVPLIRSSARGFYFDVQVKPAKLPQFTASNSTWPYQWASILGAITLPSTICMLPFFKSLLLGGTVTSDLNLHAENGKLHWPWPGFQHYTPKKASCFLSTYFWWGALSLHVSLVSPNTVMTGNRTKHGHFSPFPKWVSGAASHDLQWWPVGWRSGYARLD